ncbi:MAG: metallophosphoesterase [Candidatus Borkfalkiaceae bacterium]|nr:metallophosphoesterase [Christensenellaceae bacterium]
MDKGESCAENERRAFLSADEIEFYVGQLKKKSISFFDVPEELRNHPSIVSVERKKGIRKSEKRGYDVVRNNFFVEESIYWNRFGEKVVSKNNVVFDCFCDYYNFLQGDIYENACYYKYGFSQDEQIKYSINLSRINFESFIDKNIDDFTLNRSENETKEYEKGEENKKILKILVEELNRCVTYQEFERFIDEYSFLEDFFLYEFIEHDKEKAFDFIMRLINNGFSFGFEKSLCLIYDPQKILDFYDNQCYAKSTAKKHKSRLKHFIDDLVGGKIKKYYRSYFDEKTHYFICLCRGKYDGNSFPVVSLYKYFETFEDLAKYLKNDLTYCDFSNAILPDNFDLSKYKIDKSTKLPISYQKKLIYKVTKKYNRAKDRFTVCQTWENESGVIIKSYDHEFKYFFEFVHFLKNDLSNADLLFCDGLSNISDFSDLDLKNARLKSDILDKLNVGYKKIENVVVENFPEIEKNEDESVAALIDSRGELTFEELRGNQCVYYISDLHLMHRIKNAKCKTVNDELYLFQKIIDELLDNANKKGIILIGGDTASDFEIFKLFVEVLRDSLDEKISRQKVVFVLGNHELWNFSCEEDSNYVYSAFDEIVDKYRKVISENGMFLLQNNIILKTDSDIIEEISSQELKSIAKTDLLHRVNKARIILFGGLGFSGYNKTFNADQGIYRNAISRQQEVEETRKFEALYKKVCSDLIGKRVVIFTHTPKSDWCADDVLIKNFVYVSGHTHRNYFYDDGDYRIYSDNQIGYKQDKCRLKYFALEDDYDVFEYYEDGIYPITREQYIDFYRGKNIMMTFYREFYKLFMLKNKGYYMFVLQSENGNFLLLNGGMVKFITQKSLKYYYDNMSSVIALIKTPLDKYSEYQKLISHDVKAIGGDGHIHGAIVDIDFYNHIYINPIDFKMTAYRAENITKKEVFDGVPTLLEKECPQLYANYLKQIEGRTETAVSLFSSSSANELQIYLESNIYEASRIIKKMQKLESNILSIWIDQPQDRLLM